MKGPRLIQAITADLCGSDAIAESLRIVSIDSTAVDPGKIVGTRLASIVLLEPGDPQHQDVIPYYIPTPLINLRCCFARLIGYDGGMRIPRYTLRTLLISVAIVGAIVGLAIRQFKWIHQRHEFLSRSDVIDDLLFAGD